MLIEPSTRKRHPAAEEAWAALEAITKDELLQLHEYFASVARATKENKLGMVCADTLQRLLQEKPVSDEELLGLTWAILTNLSEPAIGKRVESIAYA